MKNIMKHWGPLWQNSSNETYTESSSWKHQRCGVSKPLLWQHV